MITDDQLLAQLERILATPRGRLLARRVVVRAGELGSEDLDLLLRATELESGVSVEELRSSTRVRGVSAVRQVAWIVARDHLGISYPQIAAAFHREHTTVMIGSTRMRERLGNDPELSDLLARIVARLGNLDDAGEVDDVACAT